MQTFLLFVALWAGRVVSLRLDLPSTVLLSLAASFETEMRAQEPSTSMSASFVDRAESRRASGCRSASIAERNFCLAELTPNGAPDAANPTRGLQDRTQREKSRLLINRSCGRMCSRFDCESGCR
jgi:hypothetical protein